MKRARSLTRVFVSVVFASLLLTPILALAAGGMFTNDFSLGQPLDAVYLGTATSGGGTALVGGGKLTLSTAANGDSAICYLLEPLAKTQANSYAAKFRFTAVSDGGSLGVLDLHTGTAPPSGTATRYLSASVVRSGVTYGLQLSRVGTDGTLRYYNFANATWGTVATKFSLQPYVTYVVKFETNTAGQFRYVVCGQAGNPLVNGTTSWTNFSTVYNDLGNTYWPYLGDAFPNGFGTLEVLSISGPWNGPPPGDTTPPAVSIASPTNGATVAGLVPIAASASDSGSGVSRVEFRVDGALLTTDLSSPYSATWDASGAAVGSHPIQATAYDVAGNSASSAISVSIAPPPDTVGPAVGITAPVDGATVSGTVLLAAAAADAGSGMSRVEFRVDDVLIGTSYGPTYTTNWNTIAVPAGLHVMAARAYDMAGNSSTATITVTVADITPPTVSISSPTNSAIVSGLVTIAATAADPGSGVDRVEFSVDGTPIGSDSTASYTATWDSTAASPGSHTIQATAYDVVGNAATASIGVTVPAPDTTPPTVSIVTPTDGSVVSGTVYIGASAGDSGGSGMSRVEFRVDGLLVGTSYQHMYVASWDSSGAAPGAHAIQATAYDNAGNSATANITVLIAPSDVTDPTVSITSPGDGSTVSGTVAIGASASDSGSGVSRVEFRVDDTPIASDADAPYSASWNTGAVSPGAHVIEAAAFDVAGNSAAATITVTVEAPPLDTTAPAVSITMPASGAAVWSSVPIAAEAFDSESGVGGVQFRVDGTYVFSDTTWPYSAIWDATGATLGSHTITARAYDLAGNAATATVQVTVVTPPIGGMFTNDFSLGQPLDTVHLGTDIFGAGTVTMTGSSMVLSTPANADSAICYFRNSLIKNEANSYAAKFQFTAVSDGGSLGVLDLHTGTAPPSGTATRYLSASVVRSGVTYGLQLSRVGTDGTLRYYNFANATWGTVATKFSLQPYVTYVVKFETNTAGQFRYVVCGQAGNPLVNGTTSWTNFSTVYNDLGNTYWPYLGDAFPNGFGTLEVLSITGR